MDFSLQFSSVSIPVSLLRTQSTSSVAISATARSLAQTPSAAGVRHAQMHLRHKPHVAVSMDTSGGLVPRSNRLVALLAGDLTGATVRLAQSVAQSAEWDAVYTMLPAATALDLGPQQVITNM